MRMMLLNNHRLMSITAGVIVLALALSAVLLPAGPAPGGSAAAYQDSTATPTATTEPATPTQTPPPTQTPEPSATPTIAAPTLVPPTPLPTATLAPQTAVEQSGLAYTQENGTLRVGALYNAYPFVWLDEFGQVVGYEADIINAIAIDLGIEVEFVQVTRQNAIEQLLTGQVDLLIGQQIHTRDRDSDLSFTHPYYINQERMVVRDDNPATELISLANQPVSVEIGSRAEHALTLWETQTGVPFDVRQYMTESEALDALAAGEVAGMVGSLDSLSRAGRQQMRLVDQPVMQEYYAIALRRYDVNLRNLLNRTLQRLKASGRLDQIYATWFSAPDDNLFTNLVPVYENALADARTLTDFPTDAPPPPDPVLARLSNGQPLRVAGLIGPGEEDVPSQARLLNNLNRALIDEMARRWGVEVQVVPNSTRNAVDLVANGQADIAVGIDPRWDGADRVEYSLPYIHHADQMLARQNEMFPRITTGFSDMLGTGWTIGYFADDGEDEERLQYFADYFGVGRNIRPVQIINENRAIYTMVVEKNLKAIFGDSLRLMALMQESEYNTEDYVRLLPTPYGDIRSITFATPRNDVDFRALVNYTLQDMAADGTYRQLWDTHFALGDPIFIPYWSPTSLDAP